MRSISGFVLPPLLGAVDDDGDLIPLDEDPGEPTPSGAEGESGVDGEEDE